MKKFDQVQRIAENQILMHLRDGLKAAYLSGQSEEYAALKVEHEETLKHAQEAYEFFKVVMKRFCISENHLESTTKAYLHEIGGQLEKIKGIKR